MAARFSVVQFSNGELADFSDATATGTVRYGTAFADAVDVATDAAPATIASVPNAALTLHGPAALAAYDAVKAHTDWLADRALFELDPVANPDPGAEPTNPQGGARAWDLGNIAGAEGEQQLVIVESDPQPFRFGGLTLGRKMFLGVLDGLTLLNSQA